ncbi:flagellar hook-associated protein FlgL [Quadrisphaera sp. KR29]|uniref:flagellar hook-associated protein FlgL n=1 Tax=Quadrisphaera sp. KR29 TaxID=3461391 RepID=UPI00404411C7
MTERVTHRSIQEASLARLQGNLQAMSLLQSQVSSGKKITKPSDDPTGTVSSLALRQQLRLNEQYTVQGDDGLSWLSMQDTALQTTTSQLRAARTLVVQALNQGVQTDGTRTAISVELDGILQTVLSLANTQYQGRSVFAGTSGPGDAVVPVSPEVTGPGTAPAVAYTPATYSWAPTGTGDTKVERQVDAQSTVRVDSNGARIFGTDVAVNGVSDADRQQSVFSLLQQIRDEIKTPKEAGPDVAVGGVDVDKGKRLGELLNRLDGAIGRVLEGLADVGARVNRIERAKEVASSAKYELSDQLSKVEDVDLPAVMIQLSLQETAYKAALTANSKVLNTSLMDFLR